MKYTPTYYEQVRDKVEELAGATTSDAQAIIEAWEHREGEAASEAWATEIYSPEDLARAILGMPAPAPEPGQEPTKAQEVAALRKFAAEQHPRSYLAAWMKYLIPCVENDLRSDIDPSDTPHTLRESVKQQLSSAVREEIQHAYDELDKVKRAIVQEREVLKKVQAEHAQAARYRDEASNQLRKALKALED